MVRSSRASGAKGAPTEAPAAPGGLSLFDLPFTVLEVILLLLPLKLRARFGTTCRAAREVVCSSPRLFSSVSTDTFGRMQTLALLRWLGSRAHGIQSLMLFCSVQKVPIGRQLEGIGMQGTRLEELLFRTMDAPIAMTAPWLSSLVRLQALTLQAPAIQLGSSCGQLAALRQLHVQCGWLEFIPELYVWQTITYKPGTVAVQPGGIPSGLTSMSFECCIMPELPAALRAATGLKELRLDHAAVALPFGSTSTAPLLEPSLSCFPALETLQLRRLQLDEQQGLPALLAELTCLQHLDLAGSPLSPGGEQVLCSAISQLSSLTSLMLDNYTSAGSVQAALAALPNLLELRRFLVPDFADQSLQLVAAAPRLRSLLVCATALLSEDNLELLCELQELTNLAVVLPDSESMLEQLAESGAARLVDAIDSLTSLEYVLLLFGSEEMEAEPQFAGIKPALEERGLYVFSLPFHPRQFVPAMVWPALVDWRLNVKSTPSCLL